MPSLCPAAFARISRWFRVSDLWKSSEWDRRNLGKNLPGSAAKGGVHEENLNTGDHRKYDNTIGHIPKELWMKYLGTQVFLAVENKSLGKIEAINAERVVIRRGSLKSIWYYFGHANIRKLKPNPTREGDARDYYLGRYLFLDMSLGEASLFASTVAPDPNIFATLGVSH